jgi:hypothetical protein
MPAPILAAIGSFIAANAAPIAGAAVGAGLGAALGPKDEPLWKKMLLGGIGGGFAGAGLGAAGAAKAAAAKTAGVGSQIVATPTGAIAANPLIAEGAKTAITGAKGIADAAIAQGMNPALATIGGQVAANPGTSAMLGLGGASALLPGGSTPNYTSSFQGPASWEEQEGAGTGTYYV